jgi:hypothetical protein
MDYKKHTKIDSLHSRAERLLMDISNHIEEIENTEFEYTEGMISKDLYEAELNIRNGLITAIALEYEGLIEKILGTLQKKQLTV